jgi:hypothetical protein
VNEGQALKHLQAGTARTLNSLASQLATGKIKPRTFLDKGRQVLATAHAQAFAIGRAKSGGSAEVSYSDHLKADRIAKAQRQFLKGFAEDIQAGRYDPKSEGGAGANVRKARAALYALRLTGTANEGWLAGLPADTEVLWVRHAEESCADCLAEAAKGWRKKGELDRYPGDGSTACVTRCKCHLETRSGEEGPSNESPLESGIRKADEELRGVEGFERVHRPETQWRRTLSRGRRGGSGRTPS